MVSFGSFNQSRLVKYCTGKETDFVLKIFVGGWLFFLASWVEPEPDLE